MTYKIGKLKVERTTMVGYGEVADPSIIVVSGSTLDTNKYEDITSIESWGQYGSILCTDYLQIRERIREGLDQSGWTGITSDAKDVVIEYYLKETAKDETTANTEKVMHLMSTKGYSQAEAHIALIEAYGMYHLKEIDACTKRASSDKMYNVIAKYLSIQDASDLIKITHKLFDLYKSQAIRGTNDGSAGEGLFDFLESTAGTSYEASGLEQQGYTLNTGDYASFISELMDILRNGNY